MDNSKKESVDRGRGAQKNLSNRFFQHHYEPLDEWFEHCLISDEDPEVKSTEYINIFPKTIITQVDSPDVPFTKSINPYQGCEHGCVYCYARNSHEYWGYNAGKDFEKKILVKKEAPKLLREYFSKLKGEPELIMLSGNTDCYQPIERKLEITRELLEICLEHKAPVGMITKNSLILRDLDILEKLWAENLVRITLSITTLDEKLRRTLEPRTTTIKQRLKTLEILSEKGFKVNVNMAPVIPGLNSSEVFELVKAVGERGANSVNYILVRLNGRIGEVFEDWIQKTHPEKAQKVLNGIKATRRGKLSSSAWKERMTGHGIESESIRQMFYLARKKFINTHPLPPVNTKSFTNNPSQKRLFD